MTAKILYITQYFPPEINAGGFRASDNVKAWTEEGAEVVVFTGWPNYPFGKIFDGYDVKLIDEESIDGVRVLRSKLVAKPFTNFISRIENGVSFLWFGLVNLHKNAKRIGTDFDIVLATSPTVFAFCLGYRFSKKLEAPFVMEFRDITYTQLKAVGTSEKSLKYKGMKWLELTLAKKADAVVVLTESFKRILAGDGVDARKIAVITNGANPVELEKAETPGIALGYFGTMGLSQNLPETIRVIGKLAEAFPAVKFLLIGEGAGRADVEEAAKGCDFVEVMSGMPKDDLESHYAKLDMSVVALRNTESFGGFLPSKIFQSWARGVPVLFFGPKGEAADLIDDNGLGLTLCGDEGENAQKLIGFFSDPEWKARVADMGDRAKKLMREKYSRKALAKEMLGFLEGVVKRKGKARS